MNIFVLLKRTFDTEEKITIKNGQINDNGVEHVINPYDEYAVEEAIKIREQLGGKVTVLTVDEEDAEKELRTALAMGADEAVLIDASDLEESDASSTVTILKAYLTKQEPDLIFVGNMAIDGGSGQVGPSLAESLRINAVTTATKVTIDNDKALVERDVEGDLEVVEVPLPLLITCQQGLNEPRYPSLPGIMKAKKKPLQKLDLDDLDLEEEDVVPKTELLEVFLPPTKGAGRVLQGELQQQVSELANLLRTEVKVV